MNGFKFVNVLRKHKECPQCKASWKTRSLKSELKDEIIHIYCTCGWSIYVNEDNKEMIPK